VYKKVLVNPNDTELKIDLQMHEDELDIFNLVLAREHAKIEVCYNILFLSTCIKCNLNSFVKRIQKVLQFKNLSQNGGVRKMLRPGIAYV